MLTCTPSVSVHMLDDLVITFRVDSPVHDNSLNIDLLLIQSEVDEAHDQSKDHHSQHLGESCQLE